jgi:hypothetical protein
MISIENHIIIVQIKLFISARFSIIIIKAKFIRWRDNQILIDF